MSYTYDYPRPAVTVDCVAISSFGEVLLIKRKHEPFKDCWALPGGFVNEGETLEDAAMREFREETGLFAGYSPIGSFSHPKRDPRGWTISFAYLMYPGGGELRAGDDAAEARWFPLDNLPPLAFDHYDIIGAGAAKT